MSTVIVILSEIDLDELPKRKSVYAIFASDKQTGKPINCRYVGETDNLQERTKTHFSKEEQNDCLKEFMQSDKIKIMIYELLPDSDIDERLEKENEWIEKYNPKCNIK
jgi:excinuclease UvrABC nuclease subunit